MLEGLKVVEMATYIAAPGAGGIMADWGADVIKVEPPGGDPIRHVLLLASASRETRESGVRTWTIAASAGSFWTRRRTSGRDALLKLIDGADIFLTNVRPGGLKRAGLDHGHAC